MFEVPVKNKFFGRVIPLAHHFCILPNIVEDKTIPELIYCFVIYAPFIFVSFSELYKLYLLAFVEPFILDEIIRNMILTYFNFDDTIKCWFLTGKLCRDLFKSIIKYENDIYESGDKGVISVYDSNVIAANKVQNNYLLGNVIMVFFYVLAPSLRDPYYIQVGNETLEYPQYPLSCWTPFDDNYWLAYVWSALAGTYSVVFFLIPDLLCYSLILFGLCQISVLKYYIENFHQYSEELSQTRRCDKATAYREFQKKCIRMHQKVIRYVEDLNSGLKILIIIDSLPSSMQLAGLIYQLMTNLSAIQFVLLGEFITLLTARVFIYCYSAHKLSLESGNIGQAWYNIDWTELPGDVQKNMLVCIARSQKHLIITIGNFGNMSLQTFLAIMKGTYSYIMFLTTMRNY